MNQSSHSSPSNPLNSSTPLEVTHSSSAPGLPNAVEPTSGQLERSLSQKIQALYRNELGHQPGKITCQLFGSKLAIILEDSVTQPEQLLAAGGKTELVEQVRSELEGVIYPHLKTLIEEILGVAVIDLLSDSTIETGRTGMIAILSDTPAVRSNTLSKGKTRSVTS